MSLAGKLAAFALLGFTAKAAPQEPGLIAHEWGTFTSVAGPNGAPIAWSPLSATADLPCFVHRLSPLNLKLASGYVRMETPVLYFYSPRPVTLSVDVNFPQGWITEWYPRASSVKPDLPPKSGTAVGVGQGHVRWEQVQASLAQTPEYPAAQGQSHYFKARETDSAPLLIGGQQEKFIFYRGVGNFNVPLQPRYLDGGKLGLRNTGREAIPLAIFFENRGGKIGYRVALGIKGAVVLDPPELTGDSAALRKQIADWLVEFGLYKKEALAMVHTWEDSWFQEGARVFYLVPRPFTDSVLPLDISPKPASTARVFVGRVEVLSPSTRQTIETALADGDVETLAKFGRFLSVFLTQMEAGGPVVRSSAAARYLDRAYAKIAQEVRAPSCVQ